MKIEELVIKNFRSIDDNGIRFTPKTDLNIVVGENNAGKTNIFRAINYLKGIITGKIELKDFDWHQEETENEIEIKAIFKLNREETSPLLRLLIGNKNNFSDQKEKIESLKRDLFEKIEIGVSYRKDVPINDTWYIKCGFLYIKYNEGDLELRELSNRKMLKWDELLNDYFIVEKHQPLHKILKDKYYADHENTVIEFDVDLSSEIQKLFDQKYKMFADFRRRPLDSDKYMVESFDGENLAAVLNSLKNGTREELEKWNSIKRTFEQLNPHLNLETERDTSGEKITICIDIDTIGLRRPLHAFGSGIFELLIFLTNMIGSEGKILVIEEPELHFHPHMQRILFEKFQEFKNNNQLFLITHSPYFIDPSNINCHALVRDINGTTQTFTNKENFDDVEKAKLYRLLNFVDYRELFFSKAIFIVEGETEKGAMPIFAEKRGKRFDNDGISVIYAGGKDNFEIFMKLLNGFEIPFIIMCDKDAITKIEAKFKQESGEFVRTSSLFCQLNNLKLLSQSEIASLSNFKNYIQNDVYEDAIFYDLKNIASARNCFPLEDDFEGILEKAGFGNLLKEAKNKFGRSKVLQGIYIADQIKPEEIPEPFLNIIKNVYNII